MDSNATNIQIDEKVFKRIALRIHIMERENLTKEKLGASEMADKIRRVIEFEVDKNDD